MLILQSAFGHPLGATGARQVVTALSELRRQDKRIAVTSMCVGTVRLWHKYFDCDYKILIYSHRAWVWLVYLFLNTKRSELHDYQAKDRVETVKLYCSEHKEYRSIILTIDLAYYFDA